MQVEPLGIMVFGHTRFQHLQVLLESLERQDVAYPVHVWLDGHHGKKDLREKVELCASMVRERYPWARLQVHNGHIGIEKMTLDGLGFMCDHYERMIILEDDCFPAHGCIRAFADCLEEIDSRPEVYSVYGHHFMMPEEKETITRFQGWGWASTREKIRPVLKQLRACFEMSEPEYLDWVRQTLTPDIERRLNVTPPRNCLVPLSMFFCWDACTSLITASRGLIHMKTPRRVIYNCGMGKESTHFHENPMLRNPPFNMITVDEVWAFYNTAETFGIGQQVDTQSVKAWMLSMFNEKNYHDVQAVLASNNGAVALSGAEQRIARLICHLGTEDHPGAMDCFRQLSLYTGSEAPPDAELATIGCMLFMQRYGDLQGFLIERFAKPGIHVDRNSSGSFDVNTVKARALTAQDHPAFTDEGYYMLGLEMHHAADRFQEAASQVYRNIFDNEGFSPKIRAWACYKYGEICRASGEDGDAREFFLRAVDLEPGHAKARIALQPRTIPSVMIGKTPDANSESIHIAMDIFDHDLWKYYFSGHRIGSLIIDLPPGVGIQSISALEPLFSQYMECGGGIRCMIDPDHQGPLVEVLRSSDTGNDYNMEWVVRDAQ